jgi:hypothetical protein
MGDARGAEPDAPGVAGAAGGAIVNQKGASSVGGVGCVCSMYSFIKKNVARTRATQPRSVRLEDTDNAFLLLRLLRSRTVRSTASYFTPLLYILSPTPPSLRV